MPTKTVKPEVINFWSLISRLYKHRDNILESSKRITEISYQIDAMDNEVTRQKALDGKLDVTELKRILCEAEKEINSILFYSNELLPHLSNPKIVPILSSMAGSLVIETTLPTKILGFKLREVALAMRLLAKSSTSLVLNPTRKSMKYAFGLQIGSEWGAIKAYIERNYSNY